MNYPNATIELRDRNWYDPEFHIEDDADRKAADQWSEAYMKEYMRLCNDAGYCQ